jgi:hypothetical protein
MQADKDSNGWVGIVLVQGGDPEEIFYGCYIFDD